jgi:hypothetical protein
LVDDLGRDLHGRDAAEVPVKRKGVADHQLHRTIVNRFDGLRIKSANPFGDRPERDRHS